MKKRYITLVVAGLMACTTLFAQENGTKVTTPKMSKHEVTASVGVGLSTFKYSMDVGKRKNKIGGVFGLGYNYNINSSWSLVTGFDIATYAAKVDIAALEDSYLTHDMTDKFYFQSELTNYSENQNAVYVNIPLMAKFELPVLGAHHFYVQGGVKVGFPLSNKFKVKNATYFNTGFYPDWDVEMSEQVFAGFGKRELSGEKRSIGMKVSCQLALETGMKWALDKDLSIYTGIYFDYGVNDVRKHSDRHLLGYTPEMPNYFRINSAMSSTYVDGDKVKNIAGKVKPMAIGFKVRLGFSL